MRCPTRRLRCATETPPHTPGALLKARDNADMLNEVHSRTRTRTSTRTRTRTRGALPHPHLQRILPHSLLISLGIFAPSFYCYMDFSLPRFYCYKRSPSLPFDATRDLPSLPFVVVTAEDSGSLRHPLPSVFRIDVGVAPCCAPCVLRMARLVLISERMPQ